MDKETAFQLRQDADLPLHKEQFEFEITLSYYRSMESRVHGDAGQDYAAYRKCGNAVQFAVCDGVGQSFFGNEAAKFAGDRLVDLLTEDHLLWSGSCHDRSTRMRVLMDSWTDEASVHMGQINLPQQTNALLASVLEEKRLLGGETTFVCGSIKHTPQGRGSLLLFLQGDSRGRVWISGQEQTTQLNAVSSERGWSTSRGCVGGAPICSEFVFGLEDRVELLVYTDGLAILDDLKAVPSTIDLMKLLQPAYESLNSDDMTMLHIVWQGQGQAVKKPSFWSKWQLRRKRQGE